MRLNRIFVSFLSLLFTGCASQHADILIKDRPLFDNGNGLVLASLGYRTAEDPAIQRQLSGGNMILGLLGPTIELTLRSVTDPKYRVYISTTDNMYENGAWSNTQVIRQTEAGRRVLIGESIKPGDYEIVDVQASLDDWDFDPAKDPNPAKVSIGGGEITYIGVFELLIQPGKNILGRTVPALGAIRVLSEIDQDLELLYGVRPDVRGKNVRNAVQPTSN
jgi:hypothetical protein